MAKAVLCGSVNLATREEVFRTVASIAGASVKRIPDGETGERSMWIRHQIPRLDAMPQLERVNDHQSYGDSAYFRLREGADPGELRFDLGYAAVAVDSFHEFAALKADGVIARGTRFQVSLPTAMAIAGSYFEPTSMMAVLSALERDLLDQLRVFTGEIPHDQLAVQWDVAAEMALVEGLVPNPFVADPGPLLDMVARLGSAIPAGAELGYHLCYGDSPGEDGRGHHFLEPANTSKLVMVANGLVERTQRAIGWIHMPVPIQRDDDAYFAALADLRLSPETELYLGLVHHAQGVRGAQRRVDVAAKYVSGFGVATECGMGRVQRELVPELLSIQAQVEVPA